jgi:hypothetical protein
MFMAAMDLTTLIFQEILKISPSIISKYTTMQDQILFLILIPHLVLLLFIVAFSKGIVGRVIGGHPGFEYLFSLVAYLFFILGGWYGLYLIPLLTTWFYLAIGMALVIFLASVVFSPARAPALFKAMAEVGKGVGEKTAGKSKKIDALEREIELVEAEIKSVKNQIQHGAGGGPLTGNSLEYALMSKTELEKKKAHLQKEQDNL